MNIGVVLAGGIGARMKAEIPKQYMLINDKEVISYSIETLQNNSNIDKVIVVADKNYHNHLVEKYSVEVCESGDSRNKTVRNVIDFILNKKYACRNIIFVDSARPLLNDEMINSGLKCLQKYSAVITCQHITDSLGYVNDLVNRDNYFLIQTPEMFQFEKMINFDKNSLFTAIYQQVEGEVCKNFITDCNIKLTYSNDIAILETLLKEWRR